MPEERDATDKNRQRLHVGWKVLLGASTVAVLVLCYSRLSYLQHQKNPDDTTIPNWRQLKEGIRVVVEVNPRSGERWLVTDLTATTTRLFPGLALGIVCAIIIGLAMGCCEPLEAILLPIVAPLTSVPIVVLLLMMCCMLGLGLGRGLFATVVAGGVVSVMNEPIRLAARAARNRFVCKRPSDGQGSPSVMVTRPALRRFLESSRSGFRVALVLVIMLEYFISDVGFGYRIRHQMRFLNMNTIYVYFGILVVFGLTVDYALRILQRMLCSSNVSEERT